MDGGDRTPETLSSRELIELGAVDSDFFTHTFFPKTVRLSSPPFHTEIWKILESSARYVNIQVFRDGAKTSLLRMYTAKRIAYALSSTILYIGKSEGHATRSVRWIRRQIETNRRFAGTFRLSPGKKWQDMECEIIHGLVERPITILALGITGSTRGVNVDDYRPDLIVVDDVIDEENSATAEQRQKITGLIYGALMNSLAPATETPDAKLAMLQTPLNREDASVLALDDRTWTSARFGVWTKETEHLPLAEQESVWPERYPSATLREEKEGYINRNQLSMWLREKECKIVSPETSAFKPNWLRKYDLEPENMYTIMAIDPVPPPSDKQIAQGLRKKDYEALVVMGRKGPNFYLLDYSLNRGHEPDWTIMEFFRLALKWHPRRVIIEAVAYQRTLLWLLKKAMTHQRRYYVVEPFTDQRSKFDRIVDAFSGPASNGHFYIQESHNDFITQFSDYPDVQHDDLLDAGSIALSALASSAASASFSDILEEEKDIPAIQYDYRKMAP